MKKNSIIGVIMLLICAIIWGTAFVAQSEAMDHMQPFTFQMARSVLGGAVLVPFILLSNAVKRRKGTYRKPDKAIKKKTLLVGILCGIILFTASMFQQFGIAMGTPGGNAGFITALYIILVPIMGLFMKRKVSPVIWLCVAIALAGLWCLCIKDTFSVSVNDSLLLVCAFVFALHIIAVDNLVPGLDGVTVSCIQFFTSAVLGAVFMLAFETPTAEQFISGAFSIIYAGVMSSGVAYTLQIVGQQRTDPTVASLLMSLESVFAVLGTIAFSCIKGVPQFPTAKEWVGCALMFVAIVAAQLPYDKIMKKSLPR